MMANKRSPMEPMWNETDWKVIVDQSYAVEFDWYAQDLLGNIAAFSSYGIGAIPNAAKSCRVAYNDLYGVIADLPEITEAVLVYHGTARFDDWLKYSRQGLFGYDYQDAHRKTPLGQYDLLTRPATPIHIDSLCLSPGLRCLVPLVGTDARASAASGMDYHPKRSRRGMDCREAARSSECDLSAARRTTTVKDPESPVPQESGS